MTSVCKVSEESAVIGHSWVLPLQLREGRLTSEARCLDGAFRRRDDDFQQGIFAQVGYVGGRRDDPGKVETGLVARDIGTPEVRANILAACPQVDILVNNKGDQRRQGIPAQRFGSADEFGAFCALLCSMQDGYMTGQNILLDVGGYPGMF